MDQRKIGSESAMAAIWEAVNNKIWETFVPFAAGGIPEKNS